MYTQDETTETGKLWGYKPRAKAKGDKCHCL